MRIKKYSGKLLTHNIHIFSTVIYLMQAEMIIFAV